MSSRFRSSAFRVPAALALAIVLAGACATTPPVRRDVAIGLVGEPASLLADDPSGRVLEAALTESLVRRDARDDFEPRLAERVPTLDNGDLRWRADDPAAPAGRWEATFRLRSGARWQDGRAITADDVRFAWERDRDAPVGSALRFRAERIDDVQVVDPRTVDVAYRAGERWADYPVGPRVLPRHILAAASPDEWAAYERAPVHAGPFEVAAWIPGYGVTLSAFDGYVLGRPALSRVEVRFFRDRLTLLDALRDGEIDIAPYPTLEADLVRTLDQLGGGSGPSGSQVYYTPGESIDVLRYGAALADPRLRLGIERSIDRTRIVDTIFAGRARIPTSYLVAPQPLAVELGSPSRLDREASRGLFAAAGYRTDAFGVLVAGESRLAVTLLVEAGSAARSAAARFVVDDLAIVGIVAEVREASRAEVVALIDRGAFDLALVAEPGSDPVAVTERYRGAAGAWFDVLAGAARASEGTERRELYVELQRSWAEARPGLPLYQRLAVDVAPRALGGVQPSPNGAPLTWNIGTWVFAQVP